MADRVKWTENASCPGCGKLAKIALSGLVGEGHQDGLRVERGASGFRTEKSDIGFQFRCVDCKRVARLIRAN
jgi:hypothetical protein